MFVRVQHDVSRKRPRWRVQLVEGPRIDGKVRQRLLREIGTAYDEDTLEQLRAEGELLKLSFNAQRREGMRPLFSSPTIAEIRHQAQRQVERAEAVSRTSMHVEELVHTGLQVSAAGLPLGYRVYPGNRYEGHTLLEAVQSLKQEGFTDSITVVADAGRAIKKIANCCGTMAGTVRIYVFAGRVGGPRGGRPLACEESKARLPISCRRGDHITHFPGRISSPFNSLLRIHCHD